MDIPKAQIIKMSSLKDLLRLVVSRMGRQSVGYIYCVKKGDQFIYFISQAVPGWYNFEGIPITMIAHDNEPTGPFIKYEMANESEEEKWSFTDFVTTSTTVVYVPIIRMEEAPDFLL